MKKQRQFILSALLIVLTSLTAYGQSVGEQFTVGDLKYKITSIPPNAAVEIVDYTGTGGAVTIHPTVNYQNTDFTVTAIARHAFEFGSVTSVTIPNTVTDIGDWAFFTNQLTEVTIPNSVTNIGVAAFDWNQLTSVTLPGKVGEIRHFAFANNPITKVTAQGVATVPAIVTDNTFSNRSQIDVVVPKGASTTAYNNAGWTGFKSIREFAPFTTTWAVDAGGSVTIPIHGDYTYDFTVDWGDNTTTEIATNDPNDARLTHTYPGAGTYQVGIYGDFPALYFNNAGDRDKIRTVGQWGDIQWATMSRAFSGCGHLDITAQDAPDQQNVANMQGMFRGSGVTGQHTDLNGWDGTRIIN